MKKLGLLVIPLMAVSLLASCGEGPHTDQPTAYQFTFEGTNCNIEHESKYETKIYEGDKNLTFTINPEYDFVLIQSDIAITGENTTYDEETHVLTISKVVGDVAVIANATTKPTFTFHGKNCDIGGEQDITKVPLQKGATDVTYLINVNDSCVLEGKDLKITGENVQYNASTHELTITEVVSPVVIEAEAYIVKTFGFNGTNCNINGSSTILANPLKKGDENVKFTISVDTGYALKENDVQITGDNTSYDADTRTVTIHKVEGDVKITAAASPLIKRKITATLTHCHFYDNPKEDGYVVGSKVKLKLIGDMVEHTPYNAPQTITVTGLQQTEWNYDSNTGLFTIPEIPEGNENIIISASSTARVEAIKIDNGYQIVLGERIADRCQDAYQINDALTYCGLSELTIVNAIAPKIDKEIILDNNREESRTLTETLTDKNKCEYAIKVENGKIIIGYQSKLARTCAVDRLLTDFLYDDGLFVPEGLYIKDACLSKEEIVTDISLPEDSLGSYRQIRDPYIVRNGEDYYMYGTMGWSGTGWRVYHTTGSFKNPWVLLNRSIVDETQYHDIDRHRWAPEVHKYGDKYYMFTTYRSKKTNKHGVTIFESSSLTEGFTMISKNEKNKVKPGHITADSVMGSTIDGSLYVDKYAQPWVVYVDEMPDNKDQIGKMDIVKFKDNSLSEIDESTDVRLFAGDESQWHGKRAYTDGCFMYKHKNDDGITMIWSADDKDANYTIGIVNNREGDDRINDPKCWVQQKRLLYSTDIYDGAINGGHAMIFDDPGGQLYLSYHVDNHGDYTRPNIIPIKEAYGTLVWDLYNFSAKKGMTV